jgi:NADH-quinone oxidoreductase subunit A
MREWYLVGSLFFDIKSAFLFPWTVVYRYLGAFSFVEMFLFIFILTYGLFYAWRKGAFDCSLKKNIFDYENEKL